MQLAPIFTAILFLEASLYSFIPLLFKPVFITRELQSFSDKVAELFWKLFLYHNLIISPAFPHKNANIREIVEISLSFLYVFCTSLKEFQFL